MVQHRKADMTIIGGGLVGLATAYALQQSSKGRKQPHIVVLEKESGVAAHQSGHNSGVIHSGLYYKPGSAKARLCVDGRRRLLQFCRKEGVRFELCGKQVVASSEGELPRLEELRRRGIQNGLRGLRLLKAAEIKRREPGLRAAGALFVPETGIVDFPGMAQALRRRIEGRGGEFLANCKLHEARLQGPHWKLCGDGFEVESGALINCAGLYSDRVAALCGEKVETAILPFRGEYYQLAPAARSLVRDLIYPLPDPAFPFLGVHYTRRIDGSIEAGPNAVFALGREAYNWKSFDTTETLAALLFPGLRRLAARHWRMGLGEIHRSLSKAAFTRALQVLTPDLKESDLLPGGSGVRAQACDRNGKLLDDFVVLRGRRAVHVINAPSPAATASLAIGEQIAAMAMSEPL
ncbi:MAG: L-2-hydroxyglutarate oxidase [Leptospirales bacterium]|nr:L-2-hydroxyglutarate oxidase [Leptospirales bacterium]